MDVVRGDFSFDIRTGKPTSTSPGKRQYLDPEIAGEGVKVITSGGDTIHFTPPHVKPVIPDWSEIKSIRHYFNRTDFHFFPTWLYHPEKPAVIVKTAEEAGEKYGVFLIQRTKAERQKYGGGEWRWEFEEWSEWRPEPHAAPKFDPRNPGSGKIYVPSAPDPQIANHLLIKELVAAIQSGQNDFVLQLLSALQAAKKPEEPVAEATKEPPPAKEEDPERVAWEAKAKEAGVKIDGRWSLERLRKEVIGALEKRVADEEARLVGAAPAATGGEGGFTA